MDKRIVPVKNYFIFAIVTIISFIIVFNLAKIYKEIKSEKETSQINLTISEVLETEINEYLTENDSKIIYLASSKDKGIIDFEKELKNYIIKEQIEKNFIYLDLSKITSAFKSDFEKIYFKNVYKNVKLEYPNMIYFKEKQVDKILYEKETKIDMEDVKSFVEKTRD